MSTTTPTPDAVLSLHDLLPAHDLARAAKLAMDTLVSILEDAKAKVNERRIAALALLKLILPSSPSSPLKRARSASEGYTPGTATSPPSPLPPPQRAAPVRERSPAAPALAHIPTAPAHHLLAACGTPGVAPAWSPDRQRSGGGGVQTETPLHPRT